MAGGHKQFEGVNYVEMFTAAAKMPTVQVILANTAHQDWEMEHIDVKSAYLDALLKGVTTISNTRRRQKSHELQFPDSTRDNTLGGPSSPDFSHLGQTC